MFQRIKDYISNSYHYMVMSRGAKFFDRNPVVQGRFEENEEWLEEIENRLAEIEERLGIEYQHTDS